MKKFLFISLLLLVAAAGMFFSCRQKTVAPEKAIAQVLLQQIEDFTAIKNKLKVAVANGNTTEAQLHTLFLEARMAYKKMEWATEYFAPTVSRFVNGPPVQEVEMTDGQVLEPAGLQVIETYLYPTYDTTHKKDILHQLDVLQAGCDKYKAYFLNIDILDWQVFDAAKQEVFRIMTLGITGFDNPLTQKSMGESAQSLQSLQKVLAHYTGKSDTGDVLGKIDAAAKYLTANAAFNSFNRAMFITAYANPVTIAISNLEARLKIHVVRYNRLLNQDAKTMFDTNAFNVNAYSPNEYSFISDKKIVLGKRLFSDPILSGNNSRSCQSCHQPDKAFTDGLEKNTMLSSNMPLRRNTPTLINSALQAAQFYDLRANTLEDQARGVVENRDEMHGSLQIAVGRLWKDTAYRRMFAAAFPKNDRIGIDTFEVMNALASFVRSLTFLNSRFDQYMRNDKTALNNEEVEGFNLFMGKAKCGTCHYMPLFNGAFPPRYMAMESEVIGVPQSLKNSAIDTDMGMYNLLKTNSLKHAFKTTTVRNAARTAPYMHNGVFTTLEQVIDFYNKGGGAGLGYKVANQTLPFDKLNLTDKESRALVAFIKSLDSK